MFWTWFCTVRWEITRRSAICRLDKPLATSRSTSVSRSVSSGTGGPEPAAGEAVFTAGLAGLVLGEFRRLAAGAPAGGADDTPRLTERETEILRLVAKGLSYKQIAARLTLSHRTVQNHVQNTLSKLQLNNRVELARYAIEKGLDG